MIVYPIDAAQAFQIATKIDSYEAITELQFEALFNHVNWRSAEHRCLVFDPVRWSDDFTHYPAVDGAILAMGYAAFVEKIQEGKVVVCSDASIWVGNIKS